MAMVTFSRHMALVLAVGLLWGCSNSSTETPPPPVELSANRSVQADTIGNIVAAKQELFVVVDMNLLNRMSESIPLVPRFH
jgi:hypothetical protein